MSDREATLRALTDSHRFPGPFTFRVIGENSPAFVDRVVQATRTALGGASSSGAPASCGPAEAQPEPEPQAQPQVTTRQSAQGHHQSVAVVVTVGTPEQVLDVYAALKAVAGVRFLL